MSSTTTITFTVPKHIGDAWREYREACGGIRSAESNASILQFIMDMGPAPYRIPLFWWTISRQPYFDAIQDPSTHYDAAAAVACLLKRIEKVLDIIPDDEPETTDTKRWIHDSINKAWTAAQRLASHRSTLEHVNRLYRWHIQKKKGFEDSWTQRYEGKKLPAPLIERYYTMEREHDI